MCDQHVFQILQEENQKDDIDRQVIMSRVKYQSKKGVIKQKMRSNFRKSRKKKTTH